MCVKLNSLFNREMKIYNVTQVLKQGIMPKRCVLTTHSKTRNRIYCQSILEAREPKQKLSSKIKITTINGNIYRGRSHTQQLPVFCQVVYRQSVLSHSGPHQSVDKSQTRQSPAALLLTQVCLVVQNSTHCETITTKSSTPRKELNMWNHLCITVLLTTRKTQTCALI